MCDKTNVPSVSSINRIVRTRTQQRQKVLQDKAIGFVGNPLPLVPDPAASMGFGMLQPPGEGFVGGGSPGMGLMAPHYGSLPSTTGLLPQQPFLNSLPAAPQGARMPPNFTNSQLPHTETVFMQTSAGPGLVPATAYHHPHVDPSYGAGEHPPQMKPALPGSQSNFSTHFNYPPGNSSPPDSALAPPMAGTISPPQAETPTGLQSPTATGPKASPQSNPSSCLPPQAGEGVAVIDPAHSPNLPVESADKAAMMSRSSSEEALAAGYPNGKRMGPASEHEGTCHILVTFAAACMLAPMLPCHPT